MSGQSALSLTDIPFVYSLANIFFIITTGDVQLERLAVVGLIAGIFGTFLVFWHPIQWIIDKLTLLSSDKYRKYYIEYEDSKPKNYTLKIPKELFRLSLNTFAIKYQKDKLVGLVYFMIILGSFSVLSESDTFQNIIEIPDILNNVFTFGPMGMMIGVGYFLNAYGKQLNESLKLHSLYFILTRDFIGYGNESNLIKTAIDLNDWATVKEIIDKHLHRNWGSMPRYTS